MRTSQIKNIVIWALVAVNVFFLGFRLIGQAVDYGRKLEMHRDLSSLLRQNGITLDPGNIREDGELYTLEASRDMVWEQELVNALLGAAVMTVQGNNYTYTGEHGRAVFKKGGEFQIVLTAGAAAGSRREIENTVRRLLGVMKIDADIEYDGKAGVSGGSGPETVTAVGEWNNREIFNCRIRFIFNEGVLEEISGKCASGIKATSAVTDMSSCATAVMRLLGEVRAGKFQCHEIYSVKPGYHLTFSVLGDGTLGPVWRLDTDAGAFYVDALTGVVEQAAE